MLERQMLHLATNVAGGLTMSNHLFAAVAAKQVTSDLGPPLVT